MSHRNEPLYVEYDIATPTSDTERLPGTLFLPHAPLSLVVFLHPTGVGHESSRDRLVAKCLAQSGHATLLSELLTEAEKDDDSLTEKYRTNFGLHEARVDKILQHLFQNFAMLAKLPLGLCGVSNGAATALQIESHHDDVRAVVSINGLAHELDANHRAAVIAPTLLIVASADGGLVAANRLTLQSLTKCSHTQLMIVEDSDHSFGGSKINDVMLIVNQWFSRWLIEHRGHRSGDQCKEPQVHRHMPECNQPLLSAGEGQGERETKR